MLLVVSDFCSAHIPTCDRAHDAFGFPFKNDDQIPSCAGSLQNLTEKFSQGLWSRFKHLGLAVL
jgi:hypothetical protein